MIRLAMKPYPKLKLMTLKENSFSVEATLPQLLAKFANTKLVYLFGSDVFCNIPKWPSATTFANSGSFIVSIRHSQDPAVIDQTTSKLQLKTTIMHSQYPTVSSRHIRQNIHSTNHSQDTPKEVTEYIKNHSLYV